MRRLILWDIDGTLVRVGEVGREAIEVGAARAAGLTSVATVKMGGKTDPQIVREILLMANMAPDHIDRLMPAALLAVEEALAATEDRVRADGVMLPGVVEVMGALADSRRAAVRQTLVTGNVAANAALKVAAFGLDRFLDAEVGAYGTDNEDRRELVPVALGRVSLLRGESYAPDEVWVIGDTRHDLACARAGGVRCLLVGTGGDPLEELADLDADAVLPDLSDTEQVLSILYG